MTFKIVRSRRQQVFNGLDGSSHQGTGRQLANPDSQFEPCADEIAVLLGEDNL
jgi:hypothetical protein